MKNKYTKIILFAFIICLMVSNLFIVPISAEDDTMILKAGTYRFNDCIDSVLEDVTAGVYQTRGYTFFNYDTIVDSDGNTITDLYCIRVNGSIADQDGTIYNYNNFVHFGESDDLLLYYSGEISIGGNSETYNCFWETPQNVTITQDTEVDDTFGTWFISNTNYNEVNSGDTCPTLQDYLNEYSGTWEDFRAMFDQAEIAGNSVFNQGLNEELNDYRIVGEQTIINSINSDNDFLSLMDTFFNYGMNNTRDVIEDQLDLVYQNGLERGSESGYQSGYNTGYNKGASDELVGNFFFNLLNTPINILNGIVIYQISDGGTPADTTDDINITVWGVLVVAVIISLFLILLKIFAGG